MKLTARITALSLATVTAVLLVAAPALAQTADGSRFTCRGSAARVNVATLERVEPAVANGNPENANPDKLVCANDFEQVTNLSIPPGPTPAIEADSAQASTSAIPSTGTTSISATGRVEQATVRLPGVVITADVTQAEASASCTSAPVLSSRVANVRINGNLIDLDPLAEGLETITTPSGQVVRIEANKTVIEGGGTDFAVTRRALEVTLLDAAQPGEDALTRAVLGEAKIDVHGNPCVGTQPPTNACPAGTVPQAGGPAGTAICVRTDPCPAGKITNPFGGSDCVILIPAGAGPCVLPAFELGGTCVLLFRGEDGGFIVPLNQLKGIPNNHPCRDKRYGPPFAIVGTQGPDRITGSNDPDRIFTLGGRDRVDGGRGGDCIDGGKGNDILDGANQNDRILGAQGRDILNGGSGNDYITGETGNDKLTGASGKDRLQGDSGKDRISGGLGNDRSSGGKGNDQINTGNGRDRASGGAGNDNINAATAGPASKVNCGSGKRDKARFNPNELRTVRKNCEKRLLLRNDGKRVR